MIALAHTAGLSVAKTSPSGPLRTLVRAHCTIKSETAALCLGWRTFRHPRRHTRTSPVVKLTHVCPHSYEDSRFLGRLSLSLLLSPRVCTARRQGLARARSSKAVFPLEAVHHQEAELQRGFYLRSSCPLVSLGACQYTVVPSCTRTSVSSASSCQPCASSAWTCKLQREVRSRNPQPLVHLTVLLLECAAEELAPSWWSPRCHRSDVQLS